MLRSKAFISFSLIIIVLAIVLLAMSKLNSETDYQLVVKEQQSAVEYVNMTVHSGDILEVHWVHSVELTPWVEVYEISEQMELTLIETRFQSFGAGVPEQTNGTVSNEDGYVVIKDLEQMIESFRWIHSHKAKFELRFNGTKIVKTKDLPHHIPMEFLIEERY